MWALPVRHRHGFQEPTLTQPETSQLTDPPILAFTRPQSGARAHLSPATVDGRNMRLLVQLRWIAVAGQLLTILAVHFGLGVPLPLVPMLSIVAALALMNHLVRLDLYRRPVGQNSILATLLMDVVALGLQLWLSGGAFNPFISLFLLQLVLGAILLTPGRVAILVAVTAAAYALLGLYGHPLQWPPALLPHVPWLLAAGSWISFVMTGGLLATFVTRVIRNLRARDAYVAELSQRAIEEDAIVRMGLLASGAAHELGTPLSTLSVILNDWSHMPRLTQDAELTQELAEMQRELGRCKTIVGDILHSVGSPRGEGIEVVRVDAFLEGLARTWTSTRPDVPLSFEPGDLAGAQMVADPAIRQVVASLLDNAADASPNGVTLSGTRTAEGLEIIIRDSGPGFPVAQLASLGTPYQSSKGAGHGLGLFLAAALARRLEGRLSARNRPEGGADVRLVLPLALDRSMDGG